MFAGKNQKRAILLSLLACLAFIALAVWSWGVPAADIQRLLWLSFMLLVLVIVAAGLLVLMLKFARILFRRNNSRPNDKPKF